MPCSREGLLRDLGVSVATCCPFYTKAVCASQHEPALSSPGRSKESAGGQRGALAAPSGLKCTKRLPPAREPWASHIVTTAKSPQPALLLPPPGTPGTAGCYCPEQRLKSLFQIDLLYDCPLNIAVILNNFKIDRMNGGSNRKRNWEMFTYPEVK